MNKRELDAVIAREDTFQTIMELEPQGAVMNRFEKVDDGYRDIKTGLIQKDEDEEGRFTYEEAMALTTDNWRLPTIEELISIVDYTKHQPATELPNIESSYFWSSSSYANDSSYAWAVNFSYGYSYRGGRGYGRCVRLVRDGEIFWQKGPER